MEITDVNQTCGACPSAWEFKADGRDAYARYRWGHLTVRVDVGDPDDMLCIFSAQLGGTYDGTLGWEEVEVRICEIDLQQRIEETQRENAEYEQKFNSDPEFRRNHWRRGLLDMNKFIEEQERENERMRKSGFSIPKSDNPAKPWDDDQINKYLDEYEADYQKKQAEKNG